MAMSSPSKSASQAIPKTSGKEERKESSVGKSPGKTTAEESRQNTGSDERTTESTARSSLRWSSRDLLARIPLTHIVCDSQKVETGTLTVISLNELLVQKLEKMEVEEPRKKAVSDNLWRLFDVLERHLAANEKQIRVDEIAETASTEFSDLFEGGETGKKQLKEVVHGLLTDLPKPGWLVGSRRADLGLLFTTALGSSRRTVLDRFRNDTRRLVVCLKDRLRIDFLNSPEGRKPAELATLFGDAGLSSINVESLAENLPVYSGSLQLSGSHRARLQKTVDILRQWLESACEPEEFQLLSSSEPLQGLFSTTSTDSEEGNIFQNAIAHFDRIDSEWVEFFRAFRTALLEVENAYQADWHDAAMSGMDWQTLSDEELALVPPVVVLADADSIGGESLDSLNSLLNSGRPIIVLLTDTANGFDAETPQNLFGASHSGLAAPITARGNVFVVQSSLAKPDHLVEGFSRLIGASRPGVALLSIPSAAVSKKIALPLLYAALESRVTPCFMFDPDAGDSWSACFDLKGNPQSHRPWPDYENENADFTALPFTLADHAALTPAGMSAFTILSKSEWSEQQCPLAEYLERSQRDAQGLIPYILVVDGDDSVERAMVPPLLVEACRERARNWRLMQELGGIDNEYARQAVERTREEAAKEMVSERENLLDAHKSELEKIRQELAGETIDRLVSMLMGDTPMSLPTELTKSSPAIEVPAPSLVASEDSAQEKEGDIEEEEDEEAGFDEPYIDSALCTTCNECTNINSLLFEYNDNKQAIIADPEAGTFAQLVQAALKCPARCIHPGKPRSGDDSASKKLIAQAAQFN